MKTHHLDITKSVKKQMKKCDNIIKLKLEVTVGVLYVEEHIDLHFKCAEIVWNALTAESISEKSDSNQS